MFETPASRRDFLKKTAYVAPLILTMNVSLAEAQAGSSRQEELQADFGRVGKNKKKYRIRRVRGLQRDDD